MTCLLSSSRPQASLHSFGMPRGGGDPLQDRLVDLFTPYSAHIVSINIYICVYMYACMLFIYASRHSFGAPLGGEPTPGSPCGPVHTTQCVHIFQYTYIHIYVCAHIYQHIHTCIYVSIHTYIYIYIYYVRCCLDRPVSALVARLREGTPQELFTQYSVCVYVSIYIYIYIHKHIYRPVFALAGRGGPTQAGSC
jgi:hypothetical protein